MKIAVAGTGYVGLVAGVCFAHVGHDVTCVDVDENKVQMMRQGISPIYEQDLEELMKKIMKKEDFTIRQIIKWRIGMRKPYLLELVHRRCLMDPLICLILQLWQDR